MAVDIFLQIPPVDNDESIEILSFSHGVSNPSEADREGSTPIISELTITKKTDVSSAPLFKACTQGQHLGTAILTVMPGGQGAGGPTTVLTFTDLIILSIQYSGNLGAGADNPVESITFHFEQLSITYTSKSPT